MKMCFLLFKFNFTLFRRERQFPTLRNSIDLGPPRCCDVHRAHNVAVYVHRVCRCGTVKLFLQLISCRSILMIFLDSRFNETLGHCLIGISVKLFRTATFPSSHKLNENYTVILRESRQMFNFVHVNKP